MSVPNQKKIYIERSSENVKRDYFKVSNANLQAAMFNLSANAFKLWVYFADNANGYSMDLYPVDFCSIANVSYSTYVRMFSELEQKGYLIQSKKQNNTYLFKEKSDTAKEPDTVMSVDANSFKDIVSQLF